jgi:hypothetical protein
VWGLIGAGNIIIGLGNIGKQVAQMAENFGMDINFYDNYEVAREVGSTLGWNACSSIREAFEAGDVVTVHVSAEDHRGNPNDGLLNYKDHFSRLAADRPDRRSSSVRFSGGKDSLLPSIGGFRSRSARGSRHVRDAGRAFGRTTGRRKLGRANCQLTRPYGHPEQEWYVTGFIRRLNAHIGGATGQNG